MFTIPNEVTPPDAFINENKTAIAWDITYIAKPKIIKNAPKPAHGVASPFRRPNKQVVS
jgi:hypothetical protein